jgi:hypothetical protein
MSYTPMAMPTGCQATIMREAVRAPVAAVKEVARGRRLASGTKALHRVMSPAGAREEPGRIKGGFGFSGFRGLEV